MSEDATASSFGSTTLESVSDECIDLITRHLAYFDVRALELCGSRALSARIERGVSQVRVLVPSLGEWPLHAFNYRNMRSLEVGNAGRECTQKLTTPVVAKDDVLIPQAGHKQIERLVIRTVLCFSVLHLNGPSLHELLPNLRSLELLGEGAFKPEVLFKNLPPNLTFLRLKPTGITRYVHRDIPTSLIASLPRSLETLLLQDCYIGNESEPFGPEIQLSFPPTLTRLQFTTTYILPALEAVPKSVTDLKLEKKYMALHQELIVSKLHSLNLKRFVFKCDDAYKKASLVLDKPFPSTLTSLKLPDEFLWFVEGEDMTKEPRLDIYLPPSLTSFHGLYRQHKLINWGTTLPLLKHADIHKSVFKETIPTKLPPLLSLRINDIALKDETVQAFPTTLTHLRATIEYTPVWLEKIESLEALTELEINESSVILPSIGFWNHLRMRLTTLQCATVHFQSLDDLCTDWPNLTGLGLLCGYNETYGPKDFGDWTVDASDMDHKLFQLPSTLKQLHLKIVTNFDFFGHSLAYLDKLEWISINVPIVEYDEQQAAQTFEQLKTLPESLTRFSIDTPIAIPPAYVQCLPKNVKELDLRRTIVNPTGNPWTNEHFQHLPPKTAFVFAQDAKPNYDEIKEHLPPTLALGLHFEPSTDLTPAMKELHRQGELFGAE